ncbi:MAG: glycosyltransferase family 2 protein [Patescibacteria group bacterium]
MLIPFCSIIILNYNGERFIKKTLESILALDYPKSDYEIIVVDNASKDKSKKIIENYIDSGSGPGMTNPGNVIPAKAGIQAKITTIFLKNNLGFSGGNNSGIKTAKGKYILLLNNDCVVDKNWLKELVAVAEKDKSIFAVNSKIYLGNTNKIQNAGIRIFPNGYAQDIGAIPNNKIQDYEEDSGQYDIEKEIPAACGAAVLYRKSILDKIGFLDESFFLYYEDVEISERAKKHGYKIIYAPNAVVHHLHAASSGEWSPFFIYHSEKGRLLHMIYHFPLPIFLKEYLRFFFKSILRLGYGVKHPKRFSQQLQYIKVSVYFVVNIPLLLIKKALSSP